LRHEASPAGFAARLGTVAALIAWRRSGLERAAARIAQPFVAWDCDEIGMQLRTAP
jgi:hypothetical protein